MADIALLVVSSGAVISSLVLLTKKIQHCSCCKGCIDCTQSTGKDDTPSPRVEQAQQNIDNVTEMARTASQSVSIPAQPRPIAFMPNSVR